MTEEKPKKEKKGKEPPEYIPPFCYWSDKFGIAIDEKAVADHVAQKFSVVSFNKVLYCYHDGKYTENRGEIEAEVQQVLDAAQTGERYTRVVREVITRITYAHPFQDSPWNPRRDLINCANCVIQIDPETGAITPLPHAAEYRFNYKLAVTYDPSASGSKMAGILADYVDEDAIPVLYEIPAMGLLHLMVDKPFKRSYLLLAPANAAKTTYLEIITTLIGKENVASVGLADLLSDRFANGALEGRILNVYDELPDTNLRGVDRFKALTGGFRHTIERKNRDRYEGTITAVHVFAANRAPEFDERTDLDDAWWTRWEIVAFTNLFDVDPLWFSKNVTDADISGYFNDVLTAVHRIRKMGPFREADPGRVKQSWTLSADFFAEFLAAEMRPIRPGEPDGEFEKEALLWAFRRWGEARGKPMKKFPQSSAMLTRIVFKHGFMTTQAGPRAARRWIYKGGWRWLDDSEYNPVKKDEPEPAAAAEGGGGLDRFAEAEA